MPAIQQKRGTAARWTSLNPVLAAGEIGYETDTGLFKIGDGVTAWNSLSYAAAAGSHSHGNPTLALTNLSGTTNSNSAGLTLSLSAAAPGGGGLTNIRVSAGTTSNLLSALTFANSNGISFGLDASTITATVKTDYLTTAALSNHSHGNPTLNLTNLSGTTDSNSAGFTLSLSAGNYLTTAALSNHSHGNPTLNLTNLSGTTDSNSAGFTLSLSAGNYLTTAALSNHSHGASASNGSFAFQTINFSNANNVTFGTSAGSIVTASVAAPGGAAITQTVGISNVTAGGSTAGTTGGVTGDDIQYVFVPGSNITMSQSINGSSGTLSIYGPAAGGGATLSGWNPVPQPALWVTSGIGNASLFLRPQDVEFAFQYDRFAMPMHFSQATNSTLTVSNTVAWGFFTRNGNSLSLYKSGSGTFSINGSGTASSANNSGIRVVSFASTDTITAGNYYLGFVWRTTTAGANASLSYIAVSQWASTISGYIGLATNTRIKYHPAGGVWTSTTAGIPNSVAFSDIRGNSSAFQRQPVFHFTSGEITY